MSLDSHVPSDGSGEFKKEQLSDFISDDLGSQASSDDLASSDALVNADLNSVSSELLASIDESTTATPTIKDSELDRILNKYNERTSATTLEKKYPALTQELFPTLVEDENFIRAKAMDFYLSVDVAARKYLKTWCVLNDRIQVWKNPRTRALRSRLATSYQQKFEPATYNLALRAKQNPEDIILLVDSAPTSREARIQGAKKLGFLNSSEYALAVHSIPARTMEIITQKPYYLNAVRAMDEIDELRSQVEKVKGVPQALRYQWAKEIDEKRKNSVLLF